MRLKARGRITRPTALLIDKSGSMEAAIDVGKRIGAMLSAVCDKELYVYAFDRMAYPITPTGTDLAAWHKAFAGITANGMTACGVPLEMMRRKKQYVEQIVLVTDEEEYDPPYFVESLLRCSASCRPIRRCASCACRTARRACRTSASGRVLR